jgi:hypothetical protein
MSVIVAIFMGLTVSAEEIIKDRKILKREAFLNLSWNSYLMSKVFVQFTISAIQAFTFVIIGNGITGIKGMMLEYWLVLFSCWAAANMLGLVISDSFKAVVTIYILIPFLVIPQIILSGVMVKFEKLNPNISSPVSIPVYGEFITARWGYEALAVKQFMNNKFERQFYQFEKMKSRGNYKRNFWCSDLKLKLDAILDDLESGERKPDFNKNLLLVYNEFRKELITLPKLKYDYLDDLTPERITPEITVSALKYIESLRKYYIDYYNFADNKKNTIIEKLQNENGNIFYKLRDDYHNQSLEEFVVNKNETITKVEFKGRLIQKMDPIFMDPEYKLVRAHFYSPTKQVFGHKADTYFVNVIVLWIMTFILYVILYMRLLKKLLDSGEAVMGKTIKASD